MKKFVVIAGLLAFSVLAHAITRNKLVTYASSLDGLKKEQLKTAAYNLMKKHTAKSYGSGKDGTWWCFYETDRVPSTNECINRYSARQFYFTSQNGKAISGMNIEHSFPKSWWGGTENNAYKDLFNLYPSDTQANSTKSNYPMGVVVTVSSEEEGYDKVGTGVIDGESGTRCWEPGDRYKGDFARAYMYMATTYQDLTWSGTQGKQQLQSGAWPTLKKWAYTLYLTWLKADPVDKLETDRNDAVYSLQNNRNLFVDYPYLAEYIWGDSINVPFHPATSITTASDDTRYNGGSGGHGGEEETGPEAPVFSLDGGNYYDAQTVTITCSTPGVTILYTTDGSAPADNGVVYNGAIEVTKTTTIKAVAVDDKGKVSEVTTAVYVIGSMEVGFKETFDLCSGTGGNDGKFSGSVASSAQDFKPDNEGWTAASVMGGKECARFGSSSKQGIVTTPSFTVNGTMVFSFKAAPWDKDGSDLNLTVNGNATLSETSLTMTQGEWTTYTLTLTGNGDVTVTFTPAKRFFLDEVCAFSETVDILLGDVNRDKDINVTDVMLVVKYILGNQMSDFYEENADLDGDGSISVTDVMLIVKYILGQ